jgi:hypothetical protein
VASALVTVRHEWKEGLRRLEAQASDRARYERLLAQVEVVTAELRRRVGGVFTIAELASAYHEADSWSREAVATYARSPGWSRELSSVVAAAFHLYARGASDYAP